VTPPPCSGARTALPLLNRDVAWNHFDTAGYVADNYATLHDFDRRIITTLSPYYRSLEPGSLGRSLDVGTGPNLYPLMLAGAATRWQEVLEYSTRNVAYLERSRRTGADRAWAPFWQLCRELDPALPADLDQVLDRLTVHHGNAFDLPRGRYDLVSMFFMAESVTGDREEFEELSHRFADAAARGGHLVAAYMAGMPKYELGGEILPSFPLDRHTLEAVMRPVTRQLRIWELPPDPTLPYEHDGVLLLTARARHQPHRVLG
jgi:hypothetical protein